jgi:YVTN family beta-propeller protein
VLLAVLVCLSQAPATAFADGGAPNLAYVTGGGASGSALTVVDIAKRQVTAQIPIGGGPTGVALSGDNRFAYVTESTANSLAIMDAHAQRVVDHMALGHQPTAILADPVASFNLLIVSESGDDTVVLLNVDTRKVLSRLHVGHHPAGLGLAAPGSGIASDIPSEAEIYVANTASDSVTVISTLQRKVIAQIPVPGGPVHVTIPATGGVAYVGTQSGTVVALSLARHQVLGTLLRLPSGPIGAMDYDAITNQIYVPAPSSAVVAVLAPASAGRGGGSPTLPSEPQRTLPLTGGPNAVAITSDGAFGFVTEHATGRLDMLDVPSHSVLTSLRVGGSPQAVITGAYPPVLDAQSVNAVAIVLALGVLAVVIIVAVVLLRRRYGGNSGAAAAKEA